MREFMIAVVMVGLWCGTVRAQDAVSITVPAAEVESRTTRVMKTYAWSDSLDELKSTAEKQGKLIFWLQIVGKLDDGL